MRRLYWAVCLSFCCLATQAQTIRPLNIGDKVPDQVWKKLPGHGTKQLFILDFWATFCSTCIEAFPKMEALQKQFDKDIQVVLINTWESMPMIKKEFDIINKRGTLKTKVALPATLPGINGDSSFRIYFPHRSIPHHVWINASREVIAITSGYNAKPDNIMLALGHKKIKADIKNDAETKLIREEGVLSPTLPSLPAALYSCLMRSHPSVPAGGSSYRKDTIRQTYRHSLYGNTVKTLYGMAYRSSFPDRARIVWEVRDSSIYRQDKENIDEWNRKYRFTYEVTGLLSEPRDERLSLMKRDVDKYLGLFLGIEAKIEKRTFDCLVFVQTKEGLLPEGTEGPGPQSKYGLLHWQNMAFNAIVEVFTQLEDMSANRPFIDETGLGKKQVNMTLKGDLGDLDNLRPQLAAYGLDIIKAKRTVDVLVVRDKQR